MAAIKKGATALILLNRSSLRQSVAQKDFEDAAGSATVVHAVTCDLLSFSSVRSSAIEANTLAAQYGGIDVLGLNAGIMASLTSARKMATISRCRSTTSARPSSTSF